MEAETHGQKLNGLQWPQSPISNVLAHQIRLKILKRYQKTDEDNLFLVVADLQIWDACTSVGRIYFIFCGFRKIWPNNRLASPPPPWGKYILDLCYLNLYKHKNKFRTAL